MPTVMILEGNSQYREMFEKAGWNITFDLNKADLVQFTGGADVSPFIYGEANHPTTGNDPRRDLVEAGYYALCVRMGKKMAGICRGGQFLNVMNGGKMYQDVDGHAVGGTHECHDIKTGKVVQVTSTHHQMMRLVGGTNVEVVAIAEESYYKEYMLGDEPAEAKYPNSDLEALYYVNTNSLCFQPHPEFYGADSTREYYFELLERYLGFNNEH